MIQTPYSGVAISRKNDSQYFADRTESTVLLYFHRHFFVWIPFLSASSSSCTFLATKLSSKKTTDPWSGYLCVFNTKTKDQKKNGRALSSVPKSSFSRINSFHRRDRKILDKRTDLLTLLFKLFFESSLLLFLPLTNFLVSSSSSSSSLF